MSDTLSCSDHALEWWIVAFLDAVTEIGIVICAIVIIRAMSVPRTTKVVASLLVAPRLVLVGSTLATALSLSKLIPYESMGTPLFLQIFVMQIGLGLSFATASLPSFRVVLKAFALPHHSSSPS
ncbi:hypothetical protein BDZ85DRAFT_266432 [Elsinoe ampelina]|uniref:Uncharacterized protein n=1 Tax=Elsinoe ampelina TaxID=302913 RepID=A0A6A6G6G8_9PEZI|nr:hypothetical protein BDZ85DRAFT_266432 [Elsinoe ampelina]